MKKVFVNSLALFVFFLSFIHLSGMEQKTRPRSSSCNASIVQGEEGFTDYFLEHLIKQIEQNDFTNFNVVQETCLEQLYNYIHITYPENEALVLKKKIERHLEERIKDSQ